MTNEAKELIRNKPEVIKEITASAIGYYMHSAPDNIEWQSNYAKGFVEQFKDKSDAETYLIENSKLFSIKDILSTAYTNLTLIQLEDAFTKQAKKLLNL